jgi:hypothetical protein
MFADEEEIFHLEVEVGQVGALVCQHAHTHTPEPFSTSWALPCLHPPDVIPPALLLLLLLLLLDTGPLGPHTGPRAQRLVRQRPAARPAALKRVELLAGSTRERRTRTTRVGSAARELRTN